VAQLVASLVTVHGLLSFHVINWSQATVIDREPERFTRWIKEAIHILIVNFQPDESIQRDLVISVFIDHCRPLDCSMYAMKSDHQLEVCILAQDRSSCRAEKWLLVCYLTWVKKNKCCSTGGLIFYARGRWVIISRFSFLVDCDSLFFCKCIIMFVNFLSKITRKQLQLSLWNFQNRWPTTLALCRYVCQVAAVECYLYPTVITAFIHLIKPGLIRWDKIECGLRSKWVVFWCVATIRCRISYKILSKYNINKYE